MSSPKRRLHETVAAILVFAVLALAGSAPAGAEQARGTGAQAAGAQGGRRINLGVGRSVIVELPRDAAEIYIADPKVANAVIRSARKLYIVAAGPGQTSIFAMDSEGRQFANFEITIGRDVGELDRILRTAMPRTEVVPRTINDTIILTGFVDSASEAQMAVDIAKGFVGAIVAGGGAGGEGKVINSLVIRGRDQVMLKVTIAEVQRNVLKQVGITNASLAGNWGTVAMQNSFVQGLSSSAANFAAGQLSAQLQAYEKNGVARILAEPTVTAVSGESAKFSAGGEVPVPSSESCANGVCTIGFTFKPYGVTLNFTPLVLAEGRILLRVATEVSEIDQTNAFSQGNISVPGFRTRKNETSVELPSGASIASAGLIQTISRQTINGLPGLMNLPILGALFRSRDYQRLETELLIVVTPFIAKPVKPSELARPTDNLVDPSDPQGVLLGRVNKLYSTANNPQVIQNYKGKFGFIAD